MTDTETQERIVVYTEGTAGPYLMVPLTQLDEVRQLLGKAGIAFSVEEDAVSLDGRPFIAIVNFESRADIGQIQAILDAQN